MSNPDKLTVRYLRTSDLTPYAGNARTHSPEQVDQIASSIREFGFTNPVLIDGEGGIIAGHGRVLAAELLKMDKVPTILLANLTPEQRRAYVIADNKLAMNAGWDEAKLAEELAALDEAGFNTSLLGFNEGELAQLLMDGSDPDAGMDGGGGEGGEGGSEGGGTPTGGGAPIVSYTLIFDSEAQQKQFHEFVRWLREHQPGETIAERIVAFCVQHSQPQG